MSKKLTLGLLAMMALCVSIAQAGTLSIVDLPATGTDEAIGINSGKTYTHAFDFGSNAPVTINGVALDQGPTSGMSSVYTGTSSWGYGYTIDDTRRPMNVPTHAGPSDAPADGGSNGLFMDFIYHSGGPVGGGTITTLSDLTAGTTYSMRYYYGPFGISAARVITFEADGQSNGIFSDTIELSLDTGGAHYLDYTFTADDTDVTMRLITHNDNQSAHIYGLTNEFAEPVTKAYSPSPKDGTLHEATWVTLGWSPGDYAVSHDVYLGDNLDDVNNGTGDTFHGNMADTMLIAGFVGYPYPDGLVPGTTYYWRIDEVNDADPNSPWKGPVWSFWVPPKKAYEAVPADGAQFVLSDVTLEWTAGFNAKLHTVYFGDNFDEVDNASGAVAQTGATFTPGTLELGKTYYWRVDEFDPPATHKGDVWSFATVPIVPISDPNLLGWWKLDEGYGAVTVDWSGYGSHGIISYPDGGLGEDGSVWDTDPQRGIVLGFNGNDSTGGFVSAGGIPEMTLTNDFTWSFWTKQHPDQSTDIAVAGNNLILGNRYSYTGADPLEFVKFTPARFEFYNNDPDYIMTVDYEDIPSAVWIHHAGVKDGTTLTYYRDGIESGTSTITKTIQANPFYMAGEPAGGGRWQGWLSDVQIYNKALTVDEIKQVMRGDPLLAWDPNPANGSTAYIKEATPLTWSPGDKVSEHAVYFGTDRDAVNNADTSDVTGVYRGQQTTSSYSPPEGVEWGGGPYYWRVDEHNTDATVTRGKIWSFTVPDYLTVDDFESYDNVDPAAGEPGINRIFDKWIDGYGTTTNGALVGNDMPPYAERTIVHSGAQALVYRYDNAGKTSEATLTLLWPRDWTAEGVTKLSLWIRGNSANAADRIYVAAGGTAVVYHDDASATQVAGWTEWVIDLQAFAGVDLTRVNTIAIGIGTKGSTAAGGSGQMYFDDIRLYR
ncbi:MAG: LamG domain-containing protein [Phycisphaerae bacterium]|nr:LamG domain-containing protein [Phycisphaerae bacterium]